MQIPVCNTPKELDALVAEIKANPNYKEDPKRFGIILPREDDPLKGTWIVYNDGTNMKSAAIFYAACGFPTAGPANRACVTATKEIVRNINHAFVFLMGTGFLADQKLRTRPRGLKHPNVQVIHQLLTELEEEEDFSKLLFVFDYTN